MSSRRFLLGDREVEVRARRDGGELCLETDDGRTLRFPVRRVGTAHFLVAEDAQQGRCHTLYAIRDGDAWWIHLDGRTWQLRHLRRRDARAGTAGRLTAPIPATVTEVLVGEGDRVDSGQVLLVLSAMKMQLEIRAPRAGTVRDLKLAAGDRVDGGQRLLRLEPLAEPAPTG